MRFLHVLSIVLLAQTSYAHNSTFLLLSNYIARSHQSNLIANNVANADTNGYEAQNLAIQPALAKKNKYSFAVAHTIFFADDTNAIKNTNRPYDLALLGKGYFKVLTPNGPRFTMNGNFLRNSAGLLTTMEGYPIASEDGDVIEVPAYDVHVARDGTIYDGIDPIGKVGIFSFDASVKLVREGDTLLRSLDGSFEEIAQGVEIMNGALNTSNVNPIKETTSMMEVEQSLKYTHQLLRDIGSMEKDAVSRLLR